jgi:hypothetical protein
MHDQRMTFLTAALLPTLLALPGGALAQDNSKVVPANAQAKIFGLLATGATIVVFRAGANPNGMHRRRWPAERFLGPILRC